MINQNDDNSSSSIEDNLSTPDSSDEKHIHKKRKLSNSADDQITIKIN